MSTLSYRDMVWQDSSEFRVRTAIYRDPSIFEAEMRNIFERKWVYIAHESEIEHPGDYLTGAIGRQPIILSRADDGQIHVMLNSCRHRGNAVCREEKGNSHLFRCPYHGWVYTNTGSLVGVTERGGYPDGAPKDVSGLIKVPCVAVYRGLIFARLSPEGETLEQYLGPVRKYVDLWVDRSPVGKLRVLRPHKVFYQGNWKFQAENGADGYHPNFVHESAFKTLEQFGLRSSSNRIAGDAGNSMGFDNGHCWLSGAYRQSMPPELFKEYLQSLVVHHGPDRAEEITRNRHIFLFPNVYLMDVNIRVIKPVSVDKTIVYSYYTQLEGVSDAINKARLRDLQRRLGTTGFISPDDMEMFAANQTGMQASGMEWLILSRGMHREKVHPDGEREAIYSDETPQRAIYREWARLMS